MIIHLHHLDYKDPEWAIEIPAKVHAAISMLQRMHATPEVLVLLNNSCIAFEIERNRVMRELDTGCDLRNIKPKKPKEDE